jgi:hypothetical protein
MLSESRQAGTLSDYGIEEDSFHKAVRALATFDCNRDDAEFFLLGLIPLLFGAPDALIEAKHRD